MFCGRVIQPIEREACVGEEWESGPFVDSNIFVSSKQASFPNVQLTRLTHLTNIVIDTKKSCSSMWRCVNCAHGSENLSRAGSEHVRETRVKSRKDGEFWNAEYEERWLMAE